MALLVARGADIYDPLSLTRGTSLQSKHAGGWCDGRVEGIGSSLSEREGVFLDDHTYVCVSGASELKDMSVIMEYSSVAAMMIDFVEVAQLSLAHTPESAEHCWDGVGRPFVMPSLTGPPMTAFC